MDATAGKNTSRHQKGKDRRTFRKKGSDEKTSKEDKIQKINFSNGKNMNSNMKLRSKMLMQLKGGRFRYLNNQLYQQDSKAAQEFFKNNRSAFEDYHKDYQQQASQWPTSPLDTIISNLKQRYQNLNETETMTVADFGCGEALISKAFEDTTVRVHSFDFVALNERVTACDMAHTKLFSTSVDYVVFCLSLMGTNCTDFIREARRVLKVGGRMLICELQSRFENLNDFVDSIKKFGFTMETVNQLHDYFLLVEFQKISNKKPKKVPNVTLLPCQYKKR